jgi:hypothetical protein
MNKDYGIFISMKNLINKTIREYLSENRLNMETKVVDGNNKPLMMYHGGSYSYGEFKGAGWFTTSKEDAEYYAEQNGGDVTEAYLIVKNPLYVGDITHLNMKLTEDILKSLNKRGIDVDVEGDVITFIEANNGVLIAQDIGCDGVIDLYNGKISDVVIFSNNQIILT